MSLDSPQPRPLRRAASLAARPLAIALPVVAALAFYAADSGPGSGMAEFVEGLPVVEALTAQRPVSAEALQVRFTTDSTATIGGESVALHPSVHAFYAARVFEPVWTDPAARDTMVAALMAVEDEGIRPAEVGADRLADRLAAVTEAESTRVDAEVLLTDSYFRFADALQGHRTDAAALYPRLWIPAVRRAAPTQLLADALLAEDPAAAVVAAVDRLRPAAPEYAALRREMARVRRDDGMPRIPDGTALEGGVTDPAVVLLRQRLTRTGDYTAGAVPDSVARIFDPSLADALRRFQTRQGLTASGSLDEATRTALNRRGDRMAPLLALNLERWRWLPDSLGERHVWVNLPSYSLQLRAREGTGWRNEREMIVVIGSPGRWSTPVFSDTITQVVFSPTWTIPASIQMESYGRVNPRGVVRGPGPGNPLGRIKFVFPNPDGIYLHDTTSRWGFERDMRALSHGCIRLHEPQALAEGVLAGEGWTTTQVDQRFTGPWETEPVNLAHPLSVHLVYFTAAPDATGRLQVFEDAYRYDERLAEALGYTAEELAAAREPA
ncbi:MAG TPA: L,D-transpeptidase family protein [Rhodothermales bacterium]|nr:L,D-transpeptidase family protein [Rhodothermales bacterium]